VPKGKLDSEFWNDLAERFLESGSQVAFTSAWLEDGTFDPAGTARFFETPNRYTAPFLHLTRVGAVKLGETDGPDVCMRWFSRLAAESDDLPRPALSPTRDLLHSPELLSERYCRQLSRQAEIGPQRTAATRRMTAEEQRAFIERAAWLKAKIKALGQSVHRFAVVSGIEHRTVARILAAEDVRADVIVKLAAALSCSVRDIPSPPES
jgi:hypothetical protein